MERIINKAVKSLVFVAAFATASSAIAQTVRINIADAQFTRPLIEKLAVEYQKQNPGFNVEIVSRVGESSDATVSITSDRNDGQGTIAHYVLLPIANENNAILAEKKVQKGLNEKVTREIFVAKTLDEYIDTRDKKQLPGTVYSLGGRHATTTELLANSLNVGVKDIKGRKVIGNEENVITVVKKRPDAIAFDVASLVYDCNTRKPVSGLKVLPIDIDGNGRVSDEERNAIASLDAFADYIGSRGTGSSLPTGSVRVSSQNKNVDAFLLWASTAGQDYVGNLGYLRSNNREIAQK